MDTDFGRGVGPAHFTCGIEVNGTVFCLPLSACRLFASIDSSLCSVNHLDYKLKCILPARTDIKRLRLLFELVHVWMSSESEEGKQDGGAPEPRGQESAGQIAATGHEEAEVPSGVIAQGSAGATRDSRTDITDITDNITYAGSAPDSNPTSGLGVCRGSRSDVSAVERAIVMQSRPETGAEAGEKVAMTDNGGGEPTVEAVKATAVEAVKATAASPLGLGTAASVPGQPEAEAVSSVSSSLPLQHMSQPEVQKQIKQVEAAVLRLFQVAGVPKEAVIWLDKCTSTDLLPLHYLARTLGAPVPVLTAFSVESSRRLRIFGQLGRRHNLTRMMHSLQPCLTSDLPSDGM